MVIYIVIRVFLDDTILIESVWDTRESAETAIQSYKKVTKGDYNIVERTMNLLTKGK